ncbi:MAG: type II toxin-antitoxin system RelE/ParE family toxin [Chlorobi bacterium]|nr:type II toxin-antitoxin system RelE/ParE family toxin [Chlorobiota bacterium]
MKIYQSSLFARKIKKFHHKQKLILDKEISKIAKDPKIGTEKRGDLKGIFIHKFKINKQLYLLSYRKKNKDIELITIGSHENYYRDLKSYLN